MRCPARAPLAALLLAVAGGAGAVPVTFTAIAEGDGAGASPFSQFQGIAAINSSGQVAFRATLDAGGGLTAIHRGAGGATTEIVRDGDPFPGGGVFTTLSDPNLNDAGTVVFAGQRTSTIAGVFGGTGGAITVFGPPPGNAFVDPTFFFGVAGNSGEVVMGAGFGSSSQLQVGTGGSPLQIYGTSTAFDPGTFFSTDLADDGSIATVVGPSPGLRQSLVVGDTAGGAPLTLLDTVADAGFQAFSLGGVAISTDASRIVVEARDAAGRAGLYVSSGGAAPALLVDDSGPFGIFGGFGPAINSAGQVAFSAQLDGNLQQEIFIGTDPVNDKLIGIGDPLFGSTVSFLDFGRFGLNDVGQVAFVAGLADGRQFVVRADPLTSAPAPATWILSMAGLMVMAALSMGEGRGGGWTRSA